MEGSFETSIDASDVDISADIDSSDVIDDISEDIPDDIPEDILENETEMTEENDLSESIPDDIPEDILENETEMTEENDISEYITDDIPEDVLEGETEMTEVNDISESIPDDIPEDILENETEMTEENDMSEDITDNIPEDVLESETKMTEESDLSEDVPDDISEDILVDSPEMIAKDNISDDIIDGAPKTQNESISDNAAATGEDTDSFTLDVVNEYSSDRANKAKSMATGGGNPPPPNDGDISSPPSTPDDTVYKRDEFELLKSGNDAINRRLEMQADDYRDKGLSEDEIQNRIAADRWNFQKEFLEDAFPGQDVSPNVFNGFSENGSKDRISEINQSEILRSHLNDSTAEDFEDYDDFSEQLYDSADNTAVEDNSSDVTYDTNDNGNNEQSEGHYDEIFDITGENITDDADEFQKVDDIVVDEKNEHTANATDDGTDWEHTSLRPDEESLLKEMEENGEIEFLQENADLADPEHTELHLPTEKTGEFFGEEGNSEFRPKSERAVSRMSEYGKDTVSYKDGYPDFSPFTTHDSEWGKINGQVEIGHMTDQRENPKWEFGRRPTGSGHNQNYDLGNFAQADNAVAEQLRETYPGIKGEDIEKYRKTNHLTWHECADGKTMQLVPEEIHSACRHSGGVSEMKYRMAWGDVTRKI